MKSQLEPFPAQDTCQREAVSPSAINSNRFHAKPWFNLHASYSAHLKSLLSSSRKVRLG